MKIVDTHTHVYLPEYDEDRDAVMARAAEAGVELMVLPGVDQNSFAPIKQLHARYPDVTVPATGIHPTEVKAEWQTQVDAVEKELAENPGLYKALGEVGIDLYWDREGRQQQLDALDAQLSIAARDELPILLHCRDGLKETLDVLQQYASSIPAAVFHCWGGDADDVARVRRVMPEAFFGIGGIVTFKKSILPAVLPTIEAGYIVTETDAPWLAPTPNRGKRNEPSYLPAVVYAIADALGCEPESLSNRLVENAHRLLGIQ